MKNVNKILSTFVQPSSETAGFKDARWFQRASDFRRNTGCCHSCRRRDVPQRVYCANYVAGKQPWEYADTDLVVLCPSCYGEMQKTMKAFRHMVFMGNAMNMMALTGLVIELINKHGDRDAALMLAGLLQQPKDN